MTKKPSEKELIKCFMYLVNFSSVLSNFTTVHKHHKA